MTKALQGLVLAGMLTSLLTGCGDDASSPVPYVAEFGPGRGDPAQAQHVLHDRVHVERLGPTGPDGRSVPLLPGAGVAWADDGTRLAVFSRGSSSCPNGPHAVDGGTDAERGQVLTVRLGPLFADRDVCTADSAPHVVIVDRPQGLTPDAPLLVQFEDEETIVLPALSGG